MKEGGRRGGRGRWRRRGRKGKEGGRAYRLCTPRTKEMASMRLDLPLPLGPMMAVKSRKGPIT